MKSANILTIDVEDYFQVGNFAKVIKTSDWGRYESRVTKNTEMILRILEEAGISTTFFVLGWVAERFPELVKEIHKAGHEVASHGYDHQLVYKQGPEGFRRDIKKAKYILEDITQAEVLGYRAPNYSITKKSMWALDILMEEGFVYDSSLFPINHDKGGMPDSKRYPFKLYRHKKSMWEFPLSTVRIMNKNIPFSGGGYFRLLPYSFIKWSIGSINGEGRPAVMYLHPWEFDPAQPKIKTDYLSMFRHYVNMSKTESKLKELLGDFRFKSVRDYLRETELDAAAA